MLDSLTVLYQFPNIMEESETIKRRVKNEYEKAKALLTGYLNERMRVTISDGRVIDGRLICTDRDCNLVLSNCEEFLSQEEMSKQISKKYAHESSVGLSSTLYYRTRKELVTC